MGLGRKIAYYRKRKNITQDALAKQLGISNQAVSKWETDQSYPDVELLPKIADIFEITMDELFDREECSDETTSDLMNQEPVVANETVQEGAWEDDGTLRVVVFLGQKMVQVDKIKETLGRMHKEITFSYKGEALNIESHINVCCENVAGNIKAGGYVECGDVGGSIAADSYVECNSVSGSIAAGSYVECDDVKENVVAGGYIECSDVQGSVKAGGYIECADVKGNVSAGGNVECGDVSGDVTAQGDVECGDVGGCVYNN